MAELVAVGYPGETTALEAKREAERLAHDLLIEPYAVASISRPRDGELQAQITACPDAAGYRAFWGLLFDLLFHLSASDRPPGAELQVLLDRIEQAGVDPEFQRRAQLVLGPGTSALFLVVERVTADKAVGALSRYGGTVLKTQLRADAVSGLASPGGLIPTGP